MDRKRTIKMTWEGLADVADDDDDRFFETYERLSCAVPLDLASSDEEDEDFEDSRISFSSAVSSAHHHHHHHLPPTKEFHNFATSAPGSIPPDYDVWMVAPGSITERRKRLFQDMGLSRYKELLSFKNNNNNNNNNQAPVNLQNNDNNNINVGEEKKQENSQTHSHSLSSVKRQNSPELVVLVRSRSEGDIECLCVDKKRKEEMMDLLLKQRLTRTSSMVLLQRAKICSYQESVSVASREPGKEFMVNECNENEMWNKLSDLQTGKQLIMEEFEKSAGHSPVVKELIRRENVNGIIDGVRKFTANSYLSKSLRMSRRTGAALLKNIKGVAYSMSSKGEKERESNHPYPLPGEPKEQKDQRQGKNGSNQWVKVRQTGKSYKELSALHLCQEIQAHEGSIWTIKFSSDAQFLASAGEDKIIHVWEVQACEVMSMNEGNLTPLHPSLGNSSDKACSSNGSIHNPQEKKKKGKQSSPDYVHVPETVFSLSDKPFCSFNGHLDDVLDLSWSRSNLLSSSMDKTVRLWDIETKSCLKLFAHNDYVTCIQFNPVDDDYFISGSLDAKVRIWSIPDRLVVDWTDLHEMVTAACYTPDGKNAIIGSHRGSCRFYSIEDGKLHQLNQVDFQTKKKSSAKKITGFQFSQTNPTEVLVTSADSRIRILDTLHIVHKFRGFRNTSSQIAASFNADGKYVVCASEDSQVYVWNREEHRNATAGKRSIITTTNHEHFLCKDVSVAIPWPGMVKGEPRPTSAQNKRHSKHISSNPTSGTSSPTKEDNPAGHSRRLLPPLPKKTKKVERVESPPEEELAQLVSRDPGISESFTSNSSSVRSGDSLSISSASDSFSNSSSIRHIDDPSSSLSNTTSTDKNSSSFSNWSSWFDIGNHSSQTVQSTAWGLVIVTATLGGEIRTYQNFGIPYRLGRL